MGNFWKFFDLPLINHEIELDLKWTKNCVIAEVPRTFKVFDTNADQINNAKLYVLAVTLPINDNTKLLENLKQVFKRTIF